MVYYSSLSVIHSDNYKFFCAAFDIPSGPGAEKLRTPAEARASAAFLYAVNSGKGGVFTNFNLDLTIVVDPDVSRSKAWRKRINPYSFIGLRQLEG